MSSFVSKEKPKKKPALRELKSSKVVDLSEYLPEQRGARLRERVMLPR